VSLRRRARYAGTALLAALLSAAVLWVPKTQDTGRTPAAGPVEAGPGRPDAGSGIIRRFAYQLSVRNTRARVLEGGVVEAFAPLAQAAGQRILALSASRPYTLVEHDHGNRSLRFELAPLPPYAARTIRIEAEMAMPAEVAGPGTSEAPDDLSVYLAPAPRVESDDPRIRDLAGRLRAPEPLQTARNIFQWAADHVAAHAYLREDRGALYALEHGRGDCSEQAYLSVALARAVGLPARVMGGYADVGAPTLEADDYHNWAEVWVDGRWVLADPNRRRFDPPGGTYLAMRVLGTAPSAGAGFAQRFAAHGDGLAVAMN
jgi:transglutaminase-like putative cysteine protease